MEVCLEEFGTSPASGSDGCGPLSPMSGPVDWKLLCEQERARADAAEARCEDLRWQEVRARARASSLASVFEKNRAKLIAARDEVKAVRQTAKRAVGFEKEALRLGRLLEASGVDARKSSTIVSLRKENAALKAEVRELRDRAAALETQNDKLRSSRSTMSKSVFGVKSEKKPRPPSKRGQQRGASGHGRTPRPGLEEREERLVPPEDARVCSCCGKPCIANGSHESRIIEIEIKAHVRRIVRPRWRCECASAPSEVTALAPARLFPGTAFGTSVWSLVLHERFMFMRPCRRVAAWLTCQGLTISPGTLADGTGRMLPLFEPLWGAILRHLNKAPLRHADETSWRIQSLREVRKSCRAWLWASLSKDAILFHVDRARSAEAAAKLFTVDAGPLFLVCDRYSAYKRLVQLLPADIILCFCWAHCRRDFLTCAAGRPDLARWEEEWGSRRSTG